MENETLGRNGPEGVVGYEEIVPAAQLLDIRRVAVTVQDALTSAAGSRRSVGFSRQPIHVALRGNACVSLSTTSFAFSRLPLLLIPQTQVAICLHSYRRSPRSRFRPAPIASVHRPQPQARLNFAGPARHRAPLVFDRSVPDGNDPQAPR